MNIGETIRVFRAEPVVSPLPGDPLGLPEARVHAAEPEPIVLEPSSSDPVRLGG